MGGTRVVGQKLEGDGKLEVRISTTQRSDRQGGDAVRQKCVYFIAREYCGENR